MKEKTLLLILSVAFTVSAQAQSQKGVVQLSEKRIERLISTLSSDEMKGRKAFTTSARKAADFIARQFRKSGLEPLNGEADFLQRFKVYRISPHTSELILNGRRISSPSYFIYGNHPMLNWKNLSLLKYGYISSEDNFQSAFSKLSNSASDHTVVLVDKVHEDIFRRYAGYFSGVSHGVQLNEGSSLLFVLTDEKSVQSGSFKLSRNIEAQEAYNVAGKITGKSLKDEYVVFSSHYDHIGVLKPIDGDSIANGADDNASGTTAVMALAERYSQLGPQPRTLIFVAFTAEEMGGYGSRYFSSQLNPDDVVAMFNIEMIGKPSKFGPNTAFLTGFDMSDMGKIMQEDLEHTSFRIYPDPYPEQNLFYRSDNATLARLGVPAHTISSVQIDRDSFYHTVDDELSTLDMEHLTNMIRAIFLSSRSIVSGDATPSRVEPSALN